MTSTPRRPWRPVWILALWLASSVATAAQAQGTAGNGSVEATFERGVAAADAGRWNEAARAFASVCEVAPTPNALLNLATARYHLKQPLAALAALDQLDALPDVTSIEQRTADRMRQRVGAMVALLAVEVEPADAQVSVDGRALPEGERQRHVLPGSHRVEASAEGHESASEAVELDSGERRTVRLVLLAEVEVDGPAPVTKTIGVAEQPAHESPPDDQRARRRRRWLWGVTSVLLAGAAAAVVVTQVDGGTAGCTTGSAGVSLGGCGP